MCERKQLLSDNNKNNYKNENNNNNKLKIEKQTTNLEILI